MGTHGHITLKTLIGNVHVSVSNSFANESQGSHLGPPRCFPLKGLCRENIGAPTSVCDIRQDIGYNNLD